MFIVSFSCYFISSPTGLQIYMYTKCKNHYCYWKKIQIKREGERKEKHTIHLYILVHVMEKRKKRINGISFFIEPKIGNRIKIDPSISCESNLNMYSCDNAHFLKTVHVEKVTIRWSEPNQDGKRAAIHSMLCVIIIIIIEGFNKTNYLFDESIVG